MNVGHFCQIASNPAFVLIKKRYFPAGTNSCKLCYSISFTLKFSLCKGNRKLKLFLTEQLRPLASESVPTISSKAQHPNLFDLNRSDNQAGSDDKARGSEWQDR